MESEILPEGGVERVRLMVRVTVGVKVEVRVGVIVEVTVGVTVREAVEVVAGVSVGVMVVVGVRVKDAEQEMEAERLWETETEGVIETEGKAIAPTITTRVTGAEANCDPRGCSDTDTEGSLSLKRIRLCRTRAEVVPNDPARRREVRGVSGFITPVAIPREVGNRS
jgi:hypothetical protein